MLARFDGCLLVATKSWALCGIVSVLDALCKVRSCHPDSLAGDRSPQKLTVQELLVISILLLSYGINTMEIVHFLNRARATTLITSW